MVVAFFCAKWSDESNAMSEVVAELAKSGKAAAHFLQVEAEDFEELCGQYGVEAVPTFIFIKVTFLKH